MARPRSRALLLALAALAAGAAPAGAITVNGGFESGDLTGWNSVGDVSVRGTIFGITPPEGSFQVLLTTRRGAGAVDVATTEAAMGLQADTLLDIFDTAGIGPGGGPPQGSAIQQSFSANAGATLTFDYNFVGSKSPPKGTFTDFLWGHLQLPDDSVISGVLNHAGQPAGAFSSTRHPNLQQTGYSTITITLPQTGSYTLTLGVHDTEDVFRDSGAGGRGSAGQARGRGRRARVLFDNFALMDSPEPGSFALLATGLLILAGHGRRPRS